MGVLGSASTLAHAHVKVRIESTQPSQSMPARWGDHLQYQGKIHSKVETVKIDLSRVIFSHLSHETAGNSTVIGRYLNCDRLMVLKSTKSILRFQRVAFRIFRRVERCGWQVCSAATSAEKASSPETGKHGRRMLKGGL